MRGHYRKTRKLLKRICIKIFHIQLTIIKGDYKIQKIASIKKIFVCLAIFCLISGTYIVNAQTLTQFSPEDNFPVLEKDGNINFAVNGTYSQAKFENNTWIFTDLKLNNSRFTLPTLEISAHNCNITIIMYSRFSSLESAGVLRYNVTGQGTQIVNFNLQPKEREWSVIFNGEFRTEGHNWQLDNEETLTITPQTVNVSIFYMDFPDELYDASIPFYLRHSASIATGAILSVIVIMAVILQFQNWKIKKESKK